MQRVARRRLLAALLASLSLMAVAIPPIAGVASAAPTSTKCSSSEGTYCFLRISAPASVQTGKAFTVNVFVTTDETRSTIAKTDPCGATAMVTLDVTSEEDPTYGPIAAKAGVATFNITLPTDGSWDLHASASADGAACESTYFDDDFRTIEAVDLQPGEPLAPCPPDVSCVQATSGTGTQATLIADTGSFTASFGPFVPAQGCGDGGPLDTNGVLTFDYTGGDPKTIVFALSSDLVTKGIGLYKICWNSTHAFTPLGGGSPVNTGYLPNCKKGDAGPCVLFKKSGQYNIAFFGILAPPGDPRGYPK